MHLSKNKPDSIDRTGFFGLPVVYYDEPRIGPVGKFTMSQVSPKSQYIKYATRIARKIKTA